MKKDSAVYTFRDYQVKAIKDVKGALKQHNSVVLQMATGSGKTITAVELARLSARYGPVWFVCHRREILRQAMAAFDNAGLRYGVIARGHESDQAPAIQLVSIDTLRARDAAGYPEPCLIIWDECHHIAAKSWSKVRSRYEHAKHIGLTATPERLDGKGLSEWFEVLVKGPPIKDLIDRDHLSNYRIFAPTEPDLTSAKMSMGDYKADDLDKIMNTAVVIGDVVDHYNRIAAGSRALVFATSINHSKSVVERFLASGVAAVHVDGTTPDDERDHAIADLASGAIRVISSVGVFSEGLDVPSVETVILLRPTKSVALYLQMIGRGLRRTAAKKSLTVLDHSGLVYEHGFPDASWEWSLAGGARRERLRKAREAGEVIRRCPACGHAHEMAPECPECGHVYAGGREVDECDGRLYELRNNKIKDGYEPPHRFAKRIGCAEVTVHNKKKHGLPFELETGHIHIINGLHWINQHPVRKTLNSRFETPDGYESKRKFSDRTGLSLSHLYKLRGLPIDEYGNIHILDGLVYLSTIKTKRNDAFIDSVKFEHYLAFSERINRSGSTVLVWIKQGLPTDGRNNIHIEKCLIWVSEKNKLTTPNGHETKTQFASRYNVSDDTVSNWVSLGLPFNVSSKSIKIEDGCNWVSSNIVVGATTEFGKRKFSEFIKSSRAKLGLTQEKMAAYLVVAPCTIVSWENGHTAPYGASQKRVMSRIEDLIPAPQH